MLTDAAVEQVLQAHEANQVVRRVGGLVLALEAGYGLPSLTGPTVLPGVHPHAMELTDADVC